MQYTVRHKIIHTQMLVVYEERTRPMGDFSWLGSIIRVSLSDLTLLIRRQEGPVKNVYPLPPRHIGCIQNSWRMKTRGNWRNCVTQVQLEMTEVVLLLADFKAAWQHQSDVACCYRWSSVVLIHPTVWP